MQNSFGLLKLPKKKKKLMKCLKEKWPLTRLFLELRQAYYCDINSTYNYYWKQKIAEKKTSSDIADI